MIQLFVAVAAVLTGAPQVPEPEFAEANAPLSIPAGPSDAKSWSYRNLVADYLRATDQQVLVSEAAEARLKTIGSTFLGSFEAPPSEVQRIFESLLALQNFALARNGGPAGVDPWRLYDLDSAEDGEAANEFTPSVSVEDLAQYQEHPALLVECSLKAEGLDARSFSSACRGLIHKNSYQGVAAVGDTNEVRIRGRAPEVSHLVVSFLAVHSEAPAWATSLQVSDLAGPGESPLLPGQPIEAGSLLEFLNHYQTLTGTALELDPSSLARANLVPVGVTEPAPMMRIDLQERLESLCASHAFTIYPVSVTPPRVLSLRWENSPGFFGKDGWMPNRVAPGDLSTWEAHPATRIRSEFVLRQGSFADLQRTLKSHWKAASPPTYVPFVNPDWVLGIDGGASLALQAAEYGRVEPNPRTLTSLWIPPASTPGSDWSLLHLVRDMEVLTGVSFKMSETVELLLSRSPSPLSRGLRVQALEADVIFEACLSQARVFIGRRENESSALRHEFELKRESWGVDSFALSIPEEELESWRGRAGRVIRTSLQAGNIQAHHFCNRARGIQASIGTKWTRPSEDGQSIEVLGPIPFVLDVKATVDQLNGAENKLAPPASWLDAFGTVREPFTLSGPRANLLEWIELVEQAAGTQFLMDQETREKARAIDTGLPLGETIPPAQVMKQLEAFCFKNNFFFVPLRASAPKMVRVSHGDVSPWAFPSTPIDSATIAEWLEHPSVVLRTTVHVPKELQSDLSNQLRGKLSQALSQQVLPFGETLLHLKSRPQLLSEMLAFIQARITEASKQPK